MRCRLVCFVGIPLPDGGAVPPWQGLRQRDCETDGSEFAATAWMCERDRYQMDELAGISLAGSVSAMPE